MTIGPVQLLVVGFDGSHEFTGEILAELRRLREHDIVRLVDLMAVRRDAEGDVEAIEISDLSEEEATEFGALAGALIGFGEAGAQGAEAGALAGAERLEDGHVFDDDQVWYVADEIPNRQRGGDRPAGAPLGDPAQGRHPRGRRNRLRRRLGPPQRPGRGWARRRRRERLTANYNWEDVMDAGRASQGQLIAGLGGALLFIFLFLPWFDSGGITESGWEGQSSTDIYLLITAVVAIGTAVTAGRGLSLPGVTMNGATALLGGVATILLLWLTVFDFPDGADRKIGLYLSLIAAIAIAIGGFRAAEE